MVMGSGEHSVFLHLHLAQNSLHFLSYVFSHLLREKPFRYIWDVCDKKFRHSDELSHHCRTYTREKTFVCFMCDQCFMCNHHLMKQEKYYTLYIWEMYQSNTTYETCLDPDLNKPSGKNIKSETTDYKWTFESVKGL